MNCSPFSSKRAACVDFFVFLQILLVLNYFTLQARTRYEKTEVDIGINIDAVAPCSFEQLKRKFEKPIVRQKDSCWTLADEILRVPATSIVNRDNLTKLGSGCLGGVYKALVQLDEDTTTTTTTTTDGGQYCVAALKTDNCYAGFENPFRGCRNHELAHSCITAGTGLNYKTFMGGEYTGALPWYGQQHLQTDGVEQKGLLPTWAIVHDTKHPMLHIVPHSFTTSRPYPDATAVGVLMPLRQFTPLSQLPDKEKVMESTKLARIFLPTAQGLAFLRSMGLSFQDMKLKNIGLTVGTDGNDPHCFLYDNSYMAIQPGLHCTSVVCQFCRERVFSEGTRKNELLRGFDALHSDMIRFRNIVLDFLDHCPDSNSAETLRQDMLECEDIEELVEVFRRHSNL